MSTLAICTRDLPPTDQASGGIYRKILFHGEPGEATVGHPHSKLANTLRASFPRVFANFLRALMVVALFGIDYVVGSSRHRALLSVTRRFRLGCAKAGKFGLVAVPDEEAKSF